MSKAVSGTREWASHSANVINGCTHGCTYCYARSMAARFARQGPGGWTDEVPGGNALGRSPKKVSGTVMFPTTHDTTPGNMGVTLPALRGLLEAGNSILFVSKPHVEVITTIVRDFTEYRSHLLFRFSIGSDNDETLLFFEPGAPTFPERFACLQLAHRAGWATSVSMEPLLETDENRVVALVERLSPFVTDSIWIGKLNRASTVMRNNGTWNDKSARAVRAVEASQNNDRIRSLYARLNGRPLVKWKESITMVVGEGVRVAADEAWTAAK